MAAERGVEYDPEAFEEQVEEHREDSPDLDEAVPVDGNEELFAEWIAASR